MKQLFLVLLLIASTHSYAQMKVYIVSAMTSKDAKKLPNWKTIRLKEKYWRDYSYSEPMIYAVVLSNGDTIVHNSLLHLGKGSLPNGDYNYIATASNTMEAKMKRSTTLKDIYLGDITERGNKKYGYKYIFHGEGKYLIQLEDAIAAGEIVLNSNH